MDEVALGQGTISQLVANIPSGLSVTASYDIREKYLMLENADGRCIVLYFSEDRSNRFLRNVGPFLPENIASDSTR